MQNLSFIISSIVMMIGLWCMLGKTSCPPVMGGAVLLIGFGSILMTIMFTMKDHKKRKK